MKRLASTTVALSFALALGAAAQDNAPADLGNPISVRQHIMKNVGGAMKLAAMMAKGKTAYDPRVANAAFRVMNNAALGIGANFPAGSETGLDTTVSPKIWSDAAGFQATLAKFLADTTAAVAATPADLDGFRVVFGKVAGNCKACHEGYRIKKK